MSAWRVPEKTLSALTEYIADKIRESENTREKAEKAGVEMAKSGTLDIRKERLLFEKLASLNNEALRQRYDDANKAFELDKPHHYKPSGYSSKYQLLKSLHCYLYQCAEGSVYKNDFYNFIDDEIVRGLESEIINELPEYKKAEWV